MDGYDVDLVTTHHFNTLWLGAPFGIGIGPSLLRLSATELQAVSEYYRWIEVRCDVRQVPNGRLTPVNGLIHVDTQLGYSLPLSGLDVRSSRVVAKPLSRRDLDCSRLAFAMFAAERYLRLGDVDADTLDERYQQWARQSANAYPHLSLAIWNEELLVGYAFAKPLSETKLNLELVTASSSSNTPGLAIYRASLKYYQSLGFRTVVASFSARNLAALNVHSALGCRFTSAMDIWILEKH